jgi:outer membrane protein OmpA-like peptidoglycan-associated protein
MFSWPAGLRRRAGSTRERGAGGDLSGRPLDVSDRAPGFSERPNHERNCHHHRSNSPGRYPVDFDKADIRPDAQVPLHEAAQLLRDKARERVMIQGYTDAWGNDTYNQRLSERRASAVKTWFATHEGLASMKFGISGFGPRNPVAPNRNPDGSDNPAGRQLNRRVTLIIHK